MIDSTLIPKNPQHQRFADRILAGDSLVDAYLAAGFKCTRNSAMHAGKRMVKRKDVSAYIRAVQAVAATSSVLTVIEIREYLARVVRKPITTLTLDEDEKDADLIKAYTINETEKSTSKRIEKYDALKAIEIDLKLSGNDPEQNNMRALADAIAALAPASPLPTGKM